MRRVLPIDVHEINEKADDDQACDETLVIREERKQEPNAANGKKLIQITVAITRAENEE